MRRYFLFQVLSLVIIASFRVSTQPNPTLSMIQFYGSRDSVVIRLRFHNNNVIWGCEGIQAAVGYNPQQMQPSLKPGRRWIHALKFASNNWLNYSNPFVEMDGIDPDLAGYAEIASSGNVTIGANQQFDLCKMNFEPQDQNTTTTFAYYGNTGASGQTGYLWIGDPDMRAFGSTSGLTAYYPVEVLSFSGYVQGDVIVLHWSTASEKNNEGFAIERRFIRDKLSQGQWSQIDFVKSRNGTTNRRTDYLTLDREKHTSGTYEYRLKQIDHDGSYDYSSIVTIAFATSFPSYSLEQNYPNPISRSSSTGNHTIIRMTIPDDADQTPIELVLYDVLGRIRQTLAQGEYAPGTYSIDVDVSQFPTGVYPYHLRRGSKTLSRAMSITP